MPLINDRIRFRAAAATALAMSLLGGRAALAQPSVDRGPEIALRTGIALPFGQVEGGNNTDLDRYASSAIPIVIEAGYRLDPALFFGVRFQYAFPQLKNPNGNCDNVSCDGSGVQLGIEGIYRFLPASRFAPWAGLAAGYEWWTADYFTTNLGAGATVSGFQASLQAGGDVRVTPQLVVGPFIDVSFGRFDSSTDRVRIGNTTNTTERDIADTAMHTWVTIGVRGAFGL